MGIFYAIHEIWVYLTQEKIGEVLQFQSLPQQLFNIIYTKVNRFYVETLGISQGSLTGYLHLETTSISKEVVYPDARNFVGHLTYP